MNRSAVFCRMALCAFLISSMSSRSGGAAPRNPDVLDRSLCDVCGLCTKECYSGALELVGRDVTVEEVMDEVLRDKPFYNTSGGGLTLSGGEPLMQIDFSEKLLQSAKDEGLHCCVETCGFHDFSHFERVLPYVDLFLYDIKDIEDDCHREYTGVSNIPILENIKQLHHCGAKIRIRLPIIPGVNDREDHFQGLALLARSLPNLCGVEVIAYHRLGTSKADRLGLSAEHFEQIEASDREMISHWIATLKKLGVNVLQ